MKLFIPIVISATCLLGGCCSSGSCGWCKNGTCSQGILARKVPAPAESGLVAQPARPATEDAAVRPASHQAPAPAAAPPAHPTVQPTMPDGPPSAMAVPPPPAAIRLEQDRQLPTPGTIAARTSSQEEWNTVSDAQTIDELNQEAELLTQRQPAQTPKGWTPTPPAPVRQEFPSVGLSN